MNRSKIEWCDHTWNPVTGCMMDCRYCYAKRITMRFAGDVRLNKMALLDYRQVPAAAGEGQLYILEEPMQDGTGRTLTYPFGFEPTMHRYRLDFPQKLEGGRNILVGAMADLFGDWVPDSWIDEVMEACKKTPIHNYLFLTKNAGRYTQYALPRGLGNHWYGVSITKNEELRLLDCLPEGCRTFLCFEPLLEELSMEGCRAAFAAVDWVIIGAETGTNPNKVYPAERWVRGIVEEADAAGIPIFMDSSLLPIVPKDAFRQEYPEQLRHTEESPKMKGRLYGVCAKCGGELKKSEMATILVRFRRGKAPKHLGFLCRNCFPGFCKDLGWELPQDAGKDDADK